MKYLLGAFLSVALLGVFGGCRIGVSVRDAAAPLLQAGESFWHHKTIRIYGLQLLPEGAVRDVLPNTQSVLWWHLHKQTVSRSLVQHPFIDEALVKPCSDFTWNCFSITVIERHPRALVASSRGVWIVDADGSYMKPVSEKALEINSRHELLPVIRGVSFALQSPELARARTKYALRTVEVIERNTDSRVVFAELHRNGELSVKFQGLRMTALFDGGEELGGRIADQTLRLQALMREFQGRENVIVSVDLAYRSSAVVKIAPPV